MPTIQSDKSMHPMPQSEGQRKQFFKTFDRRRWGFLGWGQKRMLKALNEQAKPVRDGLKESISAGMASLNSVSSEPMQRAFEDLYGRVGAKFATQIYGSLKGYSPQMQTKQVEESAFMEFMRQWIQIEGAARVQAITNTTRNRLRTFLEKALEDGLGAEETARLLSEQQGIVGLQRARVIARTEIVSASNRGSLYGAEQTNLNLDKVWISTPDSRTRSISRGDKAEHFHIDGQKVGLKQPFMVPNIEQGEEQLMFPGDPKASAATTIACRCTQGYERK